MAATMLVIAAVNPQDPGSAKAYGEQVKPLVGAAGGRLLSRLAVNQVFAGNLPPGAVTQFEFDSMEVIEGFLNSDAYQALLPLRDKGFSSMNILSLSEPAS